MKVYIENKETVENESIDWKERKQSAASLN